MKKDMVREMELNNDQSFMDSIYLFFAGELIEAQSSGELNPFEDQRRALLSWFENQSASR